MKDGFLKVAAATPEITVNATEKNSENIISQIQEAASQGAKMVVFPELCITGYTCGDLFLQSSTPRRAKEALLKILKATADLDILFVVGLPVLHCDKLYNVGAVCKDGVVLGFVTKTFLPNFLNFNEVRYFDTMPQVEFTEFDGYSVPIGSEILFCANQMESFRVAGELCEDLWTAVPPSGNHALRGATVLFNLSANNETPGKCEARRTVLSAHSARTLSAYIYADAGDGESTTDVVFAGNNMIYQCGSSLAEAKPFENGIIYGVVDLDRISQQRRQRSTFVPSYDDCYEKVFFDIELTETKVDGISKTPFIPENIEKRNERAERVFSMQCAGLKKRLKHIGIKTVTIGVSGGLDSTLALLVAARTFDLLGLDRKGIIAITMPCFGTSDRTYANSKKLAEALGVSFREVSIKKSVLQHFEDIGVSPDEYDVTYENAQARERTQVLMDVANKTGGIVVGTGDLSELALGFATYNGDHMSMYSVNSSVPKTLMRVIVSHLAEKSGGELGAVLGDIVDTPVSPELLPASQKGEIAQKTEDIIGPYEVHDFILYYFARYGFEREKIQRMVNIAFGDAYDEASLKGWVEVFYKRFFSNQFKRSAAPDGPMSTSISLSARGAWIMPSDAVFEE